MASFTLLARPMFLPFQASSKFWARSSSSTPDFIRPPGPISSWTRDEYNAYKPWKYATNTEYRQRLQKSALHYANHRYDTDPIWRRKIIEGHAQRIKQRYANDADYRQAHRLRANERWANDTDYRQAMLQRYRERYRTDPEHHDIVKQRAIDRYANDPEYREATKQRARERYWRNKFELPTDHSQQRSLDQSEPRDKSNKSKMTGL
ncbi:uncharacterized protein M437DRAFT_81807 [Aureobasidium melanogenum CBS 110374]|uniref:Uncharacterized protein n=1 Tax=Aureobasidium melanogenum (strain CBS 110374) TaxID=1043003 RepID=A0A074VZK5_AURM1|nr:uncharacterized protein M437DRAFT_81807 [Aureobasidium melanogenum CBS 110374]KEQ65963.1 hypothetical protein M437DRAFT_81807 [Aureobasidium melanogenum CBS 110374]